MPSLPQRIASYVNGVASRVESISRRIAGPEHVRDVSLPGGLPSQSMMVPGPQGSAFMKSWDVYSGRVSPSAGPTRDRWALWNATDLTPEKITNAQRSAVASGLPLEWIELIDHVFSRDIDYASVTNQRVADVMRGRWTFRRNGTDDAAGIALAFAQEAQRGCARWRDGLGWLLYSNLYTYNATEVEWKIDRITIPGPRGDKIGPFDAAVPARLHNAHPKHFRFDLYSDEPLLWIVDGYQQLPVGKFIFMEGDGQHPIKVRHGHVWQCIWHSLFSSIGLAGWAAFVDRFGMPVPTVEYDGDLAQYPEMQAAWQNILNSLGSGKGAVYPANHGKLEFKATPAGGTASGPHAQLWDACKTAKTVRVLGAELANSTGNIGSYASTTQDIATKYNLEDLDAARLSERIDEQLTAPLMLFNAEELAKAANAAGYNVTPDQLRRRVPLGRQSVPREMTPEVRARVGATLINEWGMPISSEAEFDQFDFQRALTNEDRLKGKAMSIAAGGAAVPGNDASTEGAIHVPAKPTGDSSDNEPVDEKPTDSAREGGTEGETHVS